MAKERWVVAALLIGTALGSPLRAQGTGSISGRVVDSTTQQPVANAQVQVVGTQIGGLTRLDGRYFLQSVADWPAASPGDSNRIRRSGSARDRDGRRNRDRRTSR